MLPLSRVEEIALTAAVAAFVGWLASLVKGRADARYWEAQERWKLKRDFYTQFLNSAWTLVAASERLLDLEEYEDGKIGADPGHLAAVRERVEPERETLIESAQQAWTALKESRGAAPLVVPQEVLDAFAKFQPFDMQSPYPPIDEIRHLRFLYGETLRVAQLDLHVHPRLHQPRLHALAAWLGIGTKAGGPGR